ncbi:hypothetical protein [Streptomyces sp. 6N223]|uniref:hypothetical protein n=1 Tax=Streptomyces sp. 6N223 TaxID=3457412 RepID=UPI003FD34F03
MPQPELVNTGKLADELRELAGRDELELRRDELNSLAEDLSGGHDLASWAEVDLIASFARPESLAVRPRPARLGPLRRLSRFLSSRPWQQPRALAGRLWSGLRKRAVREDLVEGILGVLVFAPLLFTWWGLWEASQAYAELREEDEEQATRPFLQLWQSGFEGRAGALGRFDNVAFLALVAISALLITAVWHAWARAREERERERQREEREYLLGELTAVLARAQLALTTHLAASPRRFAGELGKASRRLESVVSKADDGQRQLATAAGAVRDATSALETASRRVADASAPLGTATDRLEAVVKAGQAETARLSGVNAAEVRSVGDRIGLLGQQIEHAVKELTGVQRELLGSTRDVVGATDQAAQAMVASSARTNDAVDRMREAADRWDVAAAHWQDAAHRVNTGVHRITGDPPPWGPEPPNGTPLPPGPTPPAAPPVAPPATAPGTAPGTPPTADGWPADPGAGR